MCKLKERISELLAECCRKDKNSCYYAEVYTDYRDEFSDCDLRKILKSDSPRNTFDGIIDERFEDARWCLENEIIDKLSRDKELQELLKNAGNTTEDLRQILWDEFYVMVPTDQFLNQNITVDILIDTGDKNYEYASNNFGPQIYSNDDNLIPEEASLLWLSRQQGYSKSTLKRFLEQPEKKQKFLFSVYRELSNSGSSRNTLVFLAKMTLNEFFSLSDAIEAEKMKNQSYYPTKRKGRGYIVLAQDTTCGLCDLWNGSGSILEIELEKEVRLPIRVIASIRYDSPRDTFSIHGIYGCNSTLWTDDVVKEIHPMKKVA